MGCVEEKLPNKRSLREIIGADGYRKLMDLQDRALDNWHGLMEVVEDYVVIAAVILASEMTWAYGDIVTAMLMYAFAVFVIGCRMRGLAEIHHQAAHGSFARWRPLNYLGAMIAGWPVLQSYSIYRESHVVNHHHFLGDEVHDPDYVALREAGLYGNNRSPSALWNYIKSIVTPRQTFAYVKYLITHRMWSKGENRVECALRMSFYVMLFGVASCMSATWRGLVFWYWCVAMLTTNCWVGTLIELTEHYPLLETGDARTRTAIHQSRNRVCSAFEDFFFGIHAEGYHLVHHLFPRMPQWACAEAHALLLAHCKEYAAFAPADCHGWPGIMKQMFDGTREPHSVE